MPYFSGTASSSSDMLIKLQTHLVSDLPVPDRWTQDTNVLSKNGCFVEITDQGGFLSMRGGTGVDVGDNLTGAPNIIGGSYARRVSLGVVGAPSSFQFPVNYFLHVFDSPDEVYLIVKDDTSRYSHLFFGQSPVSGLPGTGNWYGAQLGNVKASIPHWDSEISESAFLGNDNHPMLCSPWSNFSPNDQDDLANNFFVHYQLDGFDWSAWRVGTVLAEPPQAYSIHMMYTILNKIPNQYNSQAILCAVPILIARPEEKTSIVADLNNLRFTRNDNLQDETVLTIGGVDWKIYPWSRRDSANRDGGFNVNHSGTYCYAIKYDGP